MPYLQIDTNLSLSHQQQEDLMTRCSSLLSQLLNKPESYVMVSLRSESRMLFGGNTDPCAYLEFKSLGLPESSTADLSKALCRLLSTETEITENRIYIEFSNPQRHLWGWNGGTF